MLEERDACDTPVAGRQAKLFLGHGPLALWVVEIPFDGTPGITELRAMFRERAGRRATPDSGGRAVGEPARRRCTD